MKKIEDPIKQQAVDAYICRVCQRNYRFALRSVEPDRPRQTYYCSHRENFVAMDYESPTVGVIIPNVSQKHYWRMIELAKKQYRQFKASLN